MMTVARAAARRMHEAGVGQPGVVADDVAPDSAVDGSRAHEQEGGDASEDGGVCELHEGGCDGTEQVPAALHLLDAMVHMS